MNEIRTNEHSSDRPAGTERHISYRQELGRKALHLLTLSIPASLLLVGRAFTLPIVLALAAVALSADFARAKSVRFNQIILRIFGFMMRFSEQQSERQTVSVNGATWVLVGAAIVIAVFPDRVAAAALCMFLVGDAAAALIGRPLGRIWLAGRSKTLEGSTAFFLAAAAFSFWIPGPTPLVGTIGALAGAIAEAIPSPVNDNVLVPIISGLAMIAMQTLTG